MIDSTYIQNLLAPYHVRVGRISEDRVSVHCPFHKEGRERHPSMSIYTDSGWVVCFTCQYGKFLDAFLMDLGMSEVAAKETKQLIKASKNSAPRTIESAPPQHISAWVGYFRKYLPKNLLDAGFKRETLDKYDVGYDKRYGRVTYPIKDRLGSIVAIVGGAVTDEFPKYKLYDEEIELPKHAIQGHRNHLWGFHLTDPERPLVVVEGYKAAMWVAQAGHSVCATQGVAYTKKQVETLAEAYRRTLIFFDQDGPGSNAGKKLQAELTTLIGPRARLVGYPRLDAKQPDWLTPEELAKVLEES